jgi:GNAT superfamily N-acetyltransferase
MLEYLKAGFWLFAPVDVNRILMREITMVLPHYRRHGIAQHLLHLDLPDSSLRACNFKVLIIQNEIIAFSTLKKIILFYLFPFPSP